jgi:DNA-binding NarL/FixJ family response regulator
MQTSILIVGENHTLSHSRAQLLKNWRTETATPDEAWAVLSSHAYDLLIICQTIPDDVATKLALEMNNLYPAAQVMVVSQPEHPRNIGSFQCTVDLAYPRWLPDAVSILLPTECSQ